MSKYLPTPVILSLVLVTLGSSCSLMPADLQPTYSQEETQEETQQGLQLGQQSKERPAPQMMQRFEQKIAAHLLSEVPSVPRVRTSAQSNALIEKLDKLINHSGLNLNLLTRQQRNQLLTLNEEYRALIFEQQYWPTKNHLADLSQLQQLATTIDQSVPNTSINAPIEATVQALIQALQENLQDQVNRGILYPKPLQLAALSASKQLPKNQESNELVDYLNEIPTTPDVGPWIRARLRPFFNEPQLLRALVQLDNQSSSIGDRELAAFYADPRYDIREELNPEQLTLDIVSLHIEEALQFYRRESAITILGISSTSSDTIRVDHNTVLVYLTSITALPAFEFQSIAYQSAGELLTIPHWPFPWRRTLALAYGQRAAEQLLDAGYFLDDESKLAHLAQQRLFIQLGIIEAKLALGQWSYSDAKVHLQNESPYTAEQIDRWLVRMLAEDGSYAAAALTSKAFSMQDIDLSAVIEQEMERQFPVDLNDLLNRPGMKKTSATTDSIDS